MSSRETQSMFRTVTLLLPMAALCCGCVGDAPADEKAAGEPEPVPIQAAEVKPTTLRPSIDLVGALIAIPERTASVSPQLGGWIEKVAVVESQAVKAGDTLVVLDDRAERVNVERAQATVAEKAASLAHLKRGNLPSMIEGARKDRDKANAAVEGLRSELVAVERLRSRNEISEVQYETKQNTLKQAEAALASAESHLKLIEEGNPPELIDQAQALLDAAKADLEHARLAVEWCTIKSPIDGVVVQLLARQGQYANQAAPLATVLDSTELFVQLRVPSRNFAQVREGTPVEIDVAAAPGRVFRGTVARISGEADPMTGNVIVFAAVKNEEGLLRPGMSCHAVVSLPEIPNALAVPASAVADRSGTSVVTVVRDGKAYETEVEVGAEAGGSVQIVKGLKPGDAVATAGGYGLPEGCPVRIVEDLAAATVAN